MVVKSQSLQAVSKSTPLLRDVVAADKAAGTVTVKDR
jgi:hypothetical protein